MMTVIFQAVLALSLLTLAWSLARNARPIRRKDKFAVLAISLSAMALFIAMPLLWLTPLAALIAATVTLTVIITFLFRRQWRKAMLAFLLLAGLLCLPFVRARSIDEAVFKLLEPAPMPVALVPASVHKVLKGDPPVLYESIEAMPDGSFYITDAFAGSMLHIGQAGQILRTINFPTGPADRLRFNGMIATLVRGRDGAVYVTVLARDPANRGLWRLAADGIPKIWAQLPETAQPNGVTTDSAGNFYIADAGQGAIWKVPADGGKAALWLKHSLIGADSILPIPTANGVKIFGAHLYVSNTADARIVRIPIGANGAPGEPEIYAEGIAADDFAFDANGALYVTTHPFNTLVRIGRDGKRTTIANAATGVVGPTSAVFGATPDDTTDLYVLNDGGFSRPLEGAVPSIVRLKIGVAGWQGFRPDLSATSQPASGE